MYKQASQYRELGLAANPKHRDLAFRFGFLTLRFIIASLDEAHVPFSDIHQLFFLPASAEGPEIGRPVVPSSPFAPFSNEWGGSRVLKEGGMGTHY